MHPAKIGIYLYITLLCMISGCRKEDASNPIVYDSPYSIYSVKAEEKVRVFTRSGELKAPGLLSYYKVKDIDQINDYANMMVAGHLGIDSLRFGANNEAVVYENYNWKTYKLSYGAKNIELSSKDTVTGFTLFDPYSKTIQYHMSSVKPIIYQEYIYNSIPVYTFGYRGIEKLIVFPQNEQLEIPLLTYAWYNYHPVNAGQYLVNRYNSLNPDFYKYIQTGDTVIVKETTVVYRR